MPFTRQAYPDIQDGAHTIKGRVRTLPFIVSLLLGRIAFTSLLLKNRFYLRHIHHVERTAGAVVVPAFETGLVEKFFRLHR